MGPIPSQPPHPITPSHLFVEPTQYPPPFLTSSSTSPSPSPPPPPLPAITCTLI
ncbi:hypothetical protein Hanom_Chr03g00261851 [Helianthus anomalus]